MRRALIVSLVAILMLAHAPLRAADDLVYARLGDFLDALRIQAGIPGMAAAIVGKNDVEWERVFGVQDIERNIPTRIDTPMHLDGITEMFTASLVLRCVEEGRLSLDDQIGRFVVDSPDASLTIRQVLTHTSGSPDNPVYQFRPDRLDPLSAAIRSCTHDSFRETLANLFDRFAMVDSVPGPDVIYLVPPAEGVLTPEFERYSAVLARLAVPYAIDENRRASVTQYSAKTLTPTSGAISTIQDLEKFDLALKNGLLLQPDTLGAAWQAPVTTSGQRLPHGMGWFAQNYAGENVFWQFGAGDAGSSSLIITWPTRSLTLIIVANSNGLVKSFNLSGGDLTTSPFGRLFLNLFIR
jgi:CubicO group peptidase (beta-lactamase class C family)